MSTKMLQNHSNFRDLYPEPRYTFRELRDKANHQNKGVNSRANQVKKTINLLGVMKQMIEMQYNQFVLPFQLGIRPDSSTLVESIV